MRAARRSLDLARRAGPLSGIQCPVQSVGAMYTARLARVVALRVPRRRERLELSSLPSSSVNSLMSQVSLATPINSTSLVLTMLRTMTFFSVYNAALTNDHGI